MTTALHIGMPKTGTTSLQAFITTHRLALSRLGFHVAPGWKRSGGHTWIPFGVDQNKGGEVSLTGGLDFVGSEVFWGRDPAKLVDLFPALAGAEVVMYVRDQLSAIPSHYQTKVKGGLALTPSEYLDRHWRLYDYVQMIDQWRSAFPRVTVRIYDRGTDAVADLFSLIADQYLGQSFDQEVRKLIADHKPERLNTTVSIGQCQAMLAINRSIEDPDMALALRKKVLYDRSAVGDFPASKAVFSDALLQRIRDTFQASNAELASRLGTSFER